MSYADIPQELKLLRQWIVWRAEDIGAKHATKVPYDARTGKLASVTEPETWIDFDTAVGVSKSYSGIGFVFTDADPYTFIDLDNTEGDTVALNRQIDLHKALDSYSEVSPSGAGLHIIIKGKVPAGRRRSFIEIYSSLRYATFTGNVYNKKPIVERQEILQNVWEQLGGSTTTFVYNGDKEEKYSDKEIVEQANRATNGDKFKSLYSGDWQTLYPSQSEADFALIDIIAFYTQNRNQITRLFRASGLGRRDKAKRADYLGWMINRSFDRMLPKIDIEGFQNELQLKLALKSEGGTLGPSTLAVTSYPSAPESRRGEPSPVRSSIPIPPGLLGEIAQFVYAAAPRPVPEIALAAAIGLMAGVTGRAYNVSGTGLNQYVLILANTGCGKEAAASGIDRLVNAIRLQVPTVNSFIGPSEIASGQALIKHLSKTSQCFVSILGEFGHRLESMSSPHANSAERALLRVLLDLFNKSGHGQVFRQTIFADSDKNIQATEAPAFSILGESVPERFYGVLNEDMISEGLLPRFMLIEYNGPRPSLSASHLQATPSMILIDKLSSLVDSCSQIMHANRVVNVAQSAEALELTENFDKYCDTQINSTIKEVIRQLWNRAHIKVLKLSALIAVGCNVSEPLIIPEYVKWSIDMVQNDIRALSEKFETGMIGTNTLEVKQSIDIIKAIKDYYVMPFEEVKKYCQGKSAGTLHVAKVISYAYLNKKLSAMASFRLDRAGATNSLKRAIQILLDSDKIRELPRGEAAQNYGTSQRCFLVSDLTMLD
jgi:hypothetical protein